MHFVAKPSPKNTPMKFGFPLDKLKLRCYSWLTLYLFPVLHISSNH